MSRTAPGEVRKGEEGNRGEDMTGKERQVAAGSSHSHRKGGQRSEDEEWREGGLGEGKGAMGAQLRGAQGR